VTAEEKHRLAEHILNLFFVRQDVYGLETEDGWLTVKQPVTLEIILHHLNGGPCLGAHPISADNRCRWIGWDIDNKRAEAFINRVAGKYSIQAILFNFTGGGRGYHVRVFFNRLISAEDSNRLAKELLQGFKGVEYFPRQISIGTEGFGNFMRLPLGRHHKTGRIGKLVRPKSIFEIKPCPPPVLLTFRDIQEACQDRVQDQRGGWNCLAIDGTVGYCKPQLCPKGGKP